MTYYLYGGSLTDIRYCCTTTYCKGGWVKHVSFDRSFRVVKLTKI